ncbi:hypothetical protein EDC04DRAFT_946412 [Pisolithus marmoratus]|nr:hypothetical protein EDC04DRAFT_946412 [Pisolithus marmoratus]
MMVWPSQNLSHDRTLKYGPLFRSLAPYSMTSPPYASFYQIHPRVCVQSMDRIISSSSLSAPWNVMSNGSTSRLSQSMHRQQDYRLGLIQYDAVSSDGYTQSQVPQCILSSSANDIPTPLAGCRQGTPRVELPSSISTEDGAMLIALTSTRRYHDTTYFNNRSSSTIEGRPVQFSHYSVPVSITRASIPFQRLHL